MTVTDLPIVGYYDVQRFRQFNPADTANWYMVPSEIGKKKVAMYPTMGRQHITFQGQNKLIFDDEPRSIYKTTNYWYAIVDNKIYRIDSSYNQVEITAVQKLSTFSGNIFNTYIIVGDPSVAGNTTYVCFADGVNLYIYNEVTQAFGIVTDPNLPLNPLCLATFGNRIVVSGAGSSIFVLSLINLGGLSLNLGTCFTNTSPSQLFEQEI